MRTNRAHVPAKVLVFSWLVVLASCASSQSTANDDPEVGETTGAAVQAVSSTSRSIATTTPPDELLSTTDTPTTAGPASSQPVGDQAELLRLAPASAVPEPLLAWDRQGLQDLGHAGRLERVAIDDLGQVAAVPQSSPVFQTTDNDRVIWQLDGSEAVGILVVPDSETLTLEGAGLDAADEPVIFYQHHIYGDPETTRSTLRSFNLVDRTVTDIASTGGWESGVHFAHLSVVGPGRGDTAVGLWGAEGWEWIEIIDVLTGEVLFDAEDLGRECFAGEPGCPSFLDAVAFDGDVIGIGPAPSDGQDVVDAFGLWIYDTKTGDMELMQAWEWDNGLWYVEDMFKLGDSVVVLSLEDGDGEPLPALFFDLVSGESWTQPEAAFLRPAFLD